jgi:hypothetical protein
LKFEGIDAETLNEFAGYRNKNPLKQRPEQEMKAVEPER